MNKFVLNAVVGMAALLLCGPVYGQDAVMAAAPALDSGVADAVLEEIDNLKRKVADLEAAVVSEAATPVVVQEDIRVVMVAPAVAATRPTPPAATPWYRSLSMKVSGTGIIQGTPGLKTTDGDSIDAALSIDLGLMMQTSKSGKVYVQLETSNGAGLDGHIPTFSQFNNDAAGTNDMKATRYWYQYSFDNGLRVNVGKIKMADYFDTNRVANSETHQFFATGFVNNMAIEFPNTKSFGSVLWYTPQSWFDIGVGYAEADADWNDVFKDPFVMMELAFKPKVLGDRQAEYRIYGWYNGKDHVRFENTGIKDDANYGFGFMLDQNITDSITIYGRYGHQRGTGAAVDKHWKNGVATASTLSLAQAWSTGFQCVGNYWGRARDVIGVAYGQGMLSDRWEEYARKQMIDPGNEHTLEIYYSVKAAKHWTFSPDLQWRKNPNGNKNEGNNWAFGLRTQFDM